MYSDLLDVLGNQGSSSITRSGSDSDNHVAVSFKAGKMKMELQENGKYWVTPDTRRGQVQLVWSSATRELKWEWMDRRDKTIVDSFKIEAPAAHPTNNSTNISCGGTFERIRDDDRVYLWTMGPKKWEMYWMQDLEKDGEDEILAQVNQYLMNPAEAAPGGAAAMESDTSTSSNNNAQVDALSNILENLVMPEGGGGGGGDTPIVASAGTLTLADLQGAMAGLQTEPQSTPTTPLSEVVTPAAITSLLQDEQVSNRLLELLPEEQRSIEHLEDNLRSPQIQQTLRALSSALMPDENGSMEGYHSVLANFQLDPRDGEAAMASGNPIQAFLDCILASVEKEEDEESKEETKEDAMEE